MAVCCWQEYFPATGNYFEQFVMIQTEFGVSLYGKLDYNESPRKLQDNILAFYFFQIKYGIEI